MAVMFSGPFFVPYMVNDLKLSMTSFVVLSSIPFFGRAIFFKRWGRAAKNYNAFWGVIISGLYIATIPYIWTFTTNFYILIFVEILSGIAWGGLELNQVLMIQNFVHEKSRVYLGTQMALANILGVIGAILGSVIMNHQFSYFDLFTYSSIFRMSVVVLMIMATQLILKEEFTLLSLKNYLRSIFGNFKFTYLRKIQRNSARD